MINTSKIRLLSMVICFSFVTIVAQELTPPLIKNNYESVTTHEELIKYLENLDNSSESILKEIIGKSVEGRDIPMVIYSGSSYEPHVKVFLFCQQHGNEPSGKEAALLLIQKLALDKDKEIYKNLDLYIMPVLNPDGNKAAKRNNANNEDINRNHFLLTEPEVLALHNQFNKILPQVTLDVHEYSAFRKSFLKMGYVRSTDAEFGAPTNLNIPKSIIEFGVDSLFKYLNMELTKSNVTFSNYYKINAPDDTVRSSTAGIIDGRQSFAILNTFSFILEGKNGESFNSDLERRSLNQLKAIESFLQFQDKNSKKIISLIEKERKNILSSKDSVVIQMDYNSIGEKINMPITVLASMKDSSIIMDYSSEIKPIKSVARPTSYLIPSEYQEVINLLDKHNVGYTILENPSKIEVEVYTVKNVEKKWLENKIFSIAKTISTVSEYECKSGDIIVPLNQNAANWISIAFEPESMWGIIQSEKFENLLKVGEQFPIYRIMAK